MKIKIFIHIYIYLFFKKNFAWESFLYFCATDSKLGPTIFLLLAWQPRHAFCFATKKACWSSLAARAFCKYIANKKTAKITLIDICNANAHLKINTSEGYLIVIALPYLVFLNALFLHRKWCQRKHKHLLLRLYC